MNLHPLAEILVEQNRIPTAAGGGGEATKLQVSLSKIIEEYTLLMGNNTAHISAAVVQLLTLGKVRLDFREHNERLALVNKGDVRSRAEAVSLIEGYLTALKMAESQGGDVEYTQKIIIQAPKRTVL